MQARRSSAAMLFALSLLALGACGGTSESKPPVAAETTTTAGRTEESKAFVNRALQEIWNQKNLDAIPKYYATDLVNHAAIPQAQGASGIRTIMTKLQAAFPDLAMHVDSVSADGDDVVVRAVLEGTQTGALEFTKFPLPATGKHVKIDQVHTFRIKDGKIVECWMVMDRLEMMNQLGVTPGAPPSPNAK